MKGLRICALLVVLAAVLSLVDCCGGGSKEKVIVEKERVVSPKEATNPTLGKQLEDLRQAYENGTITWDEYQDAKKKLLKQ